MKKIIPIALLSALSWICVACVDPVAVIDGKIINVQDSIWYQHSTEGITVDLFEWKPVNVNDDGSFQIRIPSETPEILTLYQKNKGEIGSLYISPGSRNSVIIDPRLQESTLSFSGTNQKENEIINHLEMNAYYYGYYYRNDRNHELRGDTSPKSVFDKISNRMQQDLERINSPSLPSGFREKIGQMILVSYCNLYQYAYAGFDPAENDTLKNEWILYYKQLAQMVDLDNHEVVSSPRFCSFIKNHFWILDQKEKQPFKTSDESIVFFSDLFYMHLKGRSLEAALSMLVADDYAQKDYSEPILDVCKDFYSRFPDSRLTESIRQVEHAYTQFFKKKNNANIHFMNIENVSTFQDAVTLFAGKIIYVDIWATWCGPCRAAFQYTEELRQYAKENDIVLMYISIDRKENESKWMQMAQYYNLEGQHIRANEALNEKMHVLFGNNGILEIPRYIIVDKSGKIHNSKAAKPSDMKSLKDQLKTIL